MAEGYGFSIAEELDPGRLAVDLTFIPVPYESAVP
jgi:hypothetical protein